MILLIVQLFWLALITRLLLLLLAVLTILVIVTALIATRTGSSIVIRPVETGS